VREYVENRVRMEASYMINNKTNIRDIAETFRVSKSTVHKDLSERLIKLNPQIAAEVRIIFNINIDERHLRGGESTKLKYIIN
jgi:putative DeoR family transcriptional regulator (stage III sporulation protein D)